jgi:hypothetical protein
MLCQTSSSRRHLGQAQRLAVNEGISRIAVVRKFYIPAEDLPYRISSRKFLREKHSQESNEWRTTNGGHFRPRGTTEDLLPQFSAPSSAEALF